MNLTILDNRLRALTSSEKLYLSGKKSMFVEMARGSSSIPCLSYEHIPGTLSGSADEFQIYLADLNISLKKQSRYCEVPAHMHNYVELCYMYSGQCSQIINETPVTLSKGQVLLIDINTPHSVDSLDRDDIMVNFLISKKYLQDNLFDHFSNDSILSRFFVNAMYEYTSLNRFLLFRSENSRRISMFFKELLCEFCDPSINSSDIITNLFGLIMAELINVHETDMVKTQMLSHTGVSVIPIIHYIEANYRTCTRESVASIFHLNEKYVTELLKKHTGMTYKQLVQTQKLKYAARLLRNTELPVSDIANEAGYENLNFFYKKFKEKYGQSPKEYRSF